MSSSSIKIKYCTADKVYYTISGILLTLVLIAVAYPIIFVVSASFSSGSAVSSGKVLLWPVGFNLDGYKAIFRKDDIWLSYLNTIKYTLVGTLFNLFVCMCGAYPLSRRELKGRGPLMFLFAFTMYFGGGMIPTYLLINQLRLINTFWVMVLPGALSVYNMIVMRTFIQSNIPNELYEASSMDGCSHITFLVRIVLPLSKAVIAVVALFSAVGHWNTYFNAMLYLNDRTRMPLQIILREILIMNQIDVTSISDPELAVMLANTADVLKYSLIVVATVPILCIYPFAQKYFAKGVMIGSIKG